ncbi:TATA box-binding protein-associated factor RNA polymerase I subunit D [Eublepharis macularius]|uniref:TATA box-binding protein-associated factor RNA polymerase I subunit D n=1 Tax=Eublepharis macularius TaxID=481883 RepID=A0AA97J351_EUBMA|nr:TATA box-binding protein-associated factor RNA polymerase I subunit D [Eublepharis macularius]
MPDTEESSSSENSEGPSTSHCSEGLLEIRSAEAVPGNQDPKMNGSASSSRPTSRKKVKIQNSAKLVRRPENPSATETCRGPSAESSVKSKLPKPKIDLKALFDYHFRRKQQRNRRGPRTEVAAELKNPEPRAKRPRLVVSREERRRRYRERHFQFPFVQKLYRRKHIPLKMECLFEEAALRGFFKYIEMLKYEDHLKKALMQLDAADDLERECLESRKHKYLDDDGPLSPIEETNGEDPSENCDTEDIGAKIVENSCFILSSKIPKKKKKSKMMSKS